MSKSALSKSLAPLLLAEARKIDANTVSTHVPLHVLLGESIDAARFCEHYWHADVDPKTRAVVMPGLELAGEGRLSKTIADEIVVLHDLVQDAQTAYLLAITPPSEGTERAEYVLDELSAALEWVCDDGTFDEKDARLAAVVEAHRNDGESEDALASELADYVGLAVELREDLEQIGAFDPALIEEGRRLVLTLRERSAVRARGRNRETAALLVERNQLVALLMQRIGRVRAAARYVFRHHDGIVKQVTSAYERRRRAARRKASTEATVGSPMPETTTVVASE